MRGSFIRAMRWATAVTLAMVTVWPLRASAVAYGSAAVELELMPGVRAQRVPVVCRFTRMVSQDCFEWRAWGFALPPAGAAVRVNMLAAVGRRIVAALEGSVLYTDDRGVTWQSARIDGPQTVRAIDFEPGGRFGAAVGTHGTLWTSSDAGQTWRVRRDSGNDTLVDVLVLGQTVVWSDDHGAVRVSPDGGTTVRTLTNRARDAMPVMVRFDRAVWIRLEGSRWFCVRDDGVPERVERSPWG